MRLGVVLSFAIFIYSVTIAIVSFLFVQDELSAWIAGAVALVAAAYLAFLQGAGHLSKFDEER